MDEGRVGDLASIDDRGRRRPRVGHMVSPLPLPSSLEPDCLGRGVTLESCLAKKPKVQVSWSVRWGHDPTQEVGLRRAAGIGREVGVRAHM